MPYGRFDWHEHIRDATGEYHAVRIAVDRMQAPVVATLDLLKHDNEARAYLRDADRNLEGTYLVRLFAAFEAAVRYFDRSRQPHDPTDRASSVLIDRFGIRFTPLICRMIPRRGELQSARAWGNIR